MRFVTYEELEGPGEPCVGVLKDGVMMHQHAYKEVSNPKTDFGDGINWDIFSCLLK